MAPGKESARFMEGAVYPHLGFASSAVKVGPGMGLDNGVVSLGRGRVLIVTVDPVSVIPSVGTKKSAWLSVHLVASDFTTSGFDPEFAVFSYNFPPTMPEAQREEYVRSVGEECERLGIMIVAGHTGTYPGGGFTVIGAGVMFGTAPDRGYITPAMARTGDSIVMTKHAAIEATASLALSFPRFTERKVGAARARRAGSMISLCSTVEDARRARKVGVGREGITSMHDATEGGVLGALEEMAHASRLSFAVRAGDIPVSEEATAVCRAFGIDPLHTMGEGALILTCRPSRVGALMREMSRAGIPAAEIGRVTRGKGLVMENGRRRGSRPGPDRYWTAYERATARGLG